MSAYADVKVTHVKAHGALYNMACKDAGYAQAIARAINTVDSSLIHLMMPGTEMEKATRELGLRATREAFVDRTYEPDGTLTPRNIAGAVIKDPEVAAKRVVSMVRDGKITARTGEVLDIGFDSLCVHGDEPTSVAVAKAARAALEADGVDILTLP